jgi:2-dehydro-3-deoxyglucarate aldolase/4-hydroxy-2-oxoheptanedioate aldolase
MKILRPFQLGTWLSIGSPVIAELAAECGFDWVLFDLEHGCATDAAIPDQLRALKGTDTRAIVRVGAPHPDLIGRLLDWGADGIMVPHVRSAAEAAAIVESMRYAPDGHRGMSRSARAYGYGLRPPSKAEPVREATLMVQIENIEGVQHATEIAAVEGVDVLFIGPADLQFDLQARANAAAPDYANCLHQVVNAARASGKSAGILIRERNELQVHLGLGFRQIAIDSDLSLLRKGYKEILQNAT